VNVSLDRLLAQSQFVVDEDGGISADHHRSCISTPRSVAAKFTQFRESCVQ